MLAKIYDKQGKFTGVTAIVSNMAEAMTVLKAADLTQKTFAVGRRLEDGSLLVLDTSGRTAFAFQKIGD